MESIEKEKKLVWVLIFQKKGLFYPYANDGTEI